jgi:hypothetical protein
LHDDIKYEICRLFNSLCDYILRYRIESIISFSSDIVKEVQVDQKKRYNELKESFLPSAVMARKTKEFRCPVKDQMHALVNYKSPENSQIDLLDDIKDSLQIFHELLNKACQIKERSEEEVDSPDSHKSNGVVAKMVKFLFSNHNQPVNGELLAVGSNESGDSEDTQMQENSIKSKKNFSKIF